MGLLIRSVNVGFLDSSSKPQFRPPDAPGAPQNVNTQEQEFYGPLNSHELLRQHAIIAAGLRTPGPNNDTLLVAQSLPPNNEVLPAAVLSHQHLNGAPKRNLFSESPQSSIGTPESFGLLWLDA